MDVKIILLTLIGLMAASIVFMLLILFQPEPAYVKPTFDEIMAYAEDKRFNLQTINVYYTVNLTTSEGNVVGTMRFIKDQSGALTMLSDNLKPYDGSVLLFNPIELLSTMRQNSFEEFMGLVNYSYASRPCFSTRSYPTTQTRTRFVNGDLGVVSCLDVETGYPIQTFLIEQNSKGEQAYSEIFLTQITYETI